MLVPNHRGEFVGRYRTLDSAIGIALKPAGVLAFDAEPRLDMPGLISTLMFGTARIAHNGRYFVARYSVQDNSFPMTNTWAVGTMPSARPETEADGRFRPANQK
jgi:hypothetical protein